jgi:hypothetical protein
MDNDIERLSSKFVESCNVEDDTENELEKLNASDNEKDNAFVKSSNDRKNDIMNESDDQSVEKQTFEEKRKINFTDLPLDVLHLVIEFSRQSRSLTATNRHFYKVRRHLYWKLNRTYSFYYYDDEDFRTLVHSRVENPSKQLSLNLRKCSDITDVSALGGVHTLDLSDCRNIYDVSALWGVHTLNLHGCRNITDVSALGGVRDLNLCACWEITDVSALGGVHTLDLSYCPDITDVSALGGVHTLNLSYCTDITDVSALSGVHTLDLWGCDNIDVSLWYGPNSPYKN